MPSLTETASDAELLERGRHGDAEAFAVFYRRHERLVLAWLLKQTRDASLAADLAAETFAAAYLGADRFQPDVAPAFAWLLGIARNKLRSTARRHRIEDHARRKLGVERLAWDDDELARVEACDDTVLDLLAALPAEQRDAVRAHVVEDESYADAAARLRTSPAVVRKRVSRGLAVLRRRLTQEASNP
ncbi:MAG TPA: RNA polymerase sigma factor [Conexibacter sp.]|nr:RNA polymerase sigma factor [Conexibacter sp.]